MGSFAASINRDLVQYVIAWKWTSHQSFMITSTVLATQHQSPPHKSWVEEKMEVIICRCIHFNYTQRMVLFVRDGVEAVEERVVIIIVNGSPKVRNMTMTNPNY